MRVASSDPNSLRIEPSGPGGSPRSRRVSPRSRVTCSALASIASCANCWRMWLSRNAGSCRFGNCFASSRRRAICAACWRPAAPPRSSIKVWVGAGARLGMARAPDLVEAEDPWQIPFFLLFGARMNEGWAQQAHADRAGQDRRAGAEILFVEDHLLHKAGAAPAIFLWPGQADPAGRVHLLLPRAALF